MNETKNNHFNSKTYLESFECEDKKGHVFCTTRTKQKNAIVWSKIKRPMAIDSVCYLEDFFTDFLKKTPDRRTLEMDFKTSFEDFWPKIIKCIKNFPFLLYRNRFIKKREIFNELQIKTIINFIIQQYKRTPKMRNAISNEIHLNKKEIARIKKENPKSTKKQIQQIHEHHTHLELIKQPQPQTEKLLEIIDWQLVINHSDTPFITSDSPVIWHDEIKIDNKAAIIVTLTPFFALAIQINTQANSDAVIFHFTDKNFTRRINMLIRDRALSENQRYSRLISNKKGILLELIEDK